MSDVLLIAYHSLPVADSQQEIIIPADLPLVQELGATLREWAQIWQNLYVVRVNYLSVHRSVSSTHGSVKIPLLVYIFVK